MQAHNKGKRAASRLTGKRMYIARPWDNVKGFLSISLVSALAYGYSMIPSPELINPLVQIHPVETVEAAKIVPITPPPTLTPKNEIEAYIVQVFGDEAENAFKVLSCENKGLNPKAVNHNRNGSIDQGIFQINNIHRNGKAKGKDMFDYRQNIEVAHQIFLEQGWSPWTCSHKVGVTPFYLK